jgi:hypothetical protein
MRRGCLSVGTVDCNICQRHIPYPERYLMVDEDEQGEEVERGGHSVRYCVECAQKKGYAHYKELKGEMVLTFLRESEGSLSAESEGGPESGEEPAAESAPDAETSEETGEEQE